MSWSSPNTASRLFRTAALALACWPSLGWAVTLVTPLPGPLALEKTNANRIVATPDDVLHAVYVDTSAPGQAKPIRYVFSTTRGASWSSPVTVASGGAPALAADSAGNLGLVYVGAPYLSPGSNQYGAVLYRSKPAGGAWSGQTQLASFGAEPAMVGFQGDMHLTWYDPTHLWYRTFSSLSPGGFNQLVRADFICCSWFAWWSQPSIAVAPRTGGGAPVVRIGVYEARNGSDGFAAGAYVFEQITGGAWAAPFSDLDTLPTPPPASQYSPYSLSLTANAASGTAYLAYAKSWNGVGVTRLARVPQGGPGSRVDLWADRAIVDVTADNAPTSESFKVAFSPAGSTPHTATYLLQGTWAAGAPSPSLGSLELKSSAGRSGNTIYFTRATASGGQEGIHLLWEEEGSTGADLMVDYFQTSPPARSGMTWALIAHNNTFNVDHVGCQGCNAYTGDTSCSQKRPVLCLLRDGSPNPGIPVDFYNGWIGGHIALSPYTRGAALTSLAVANSICENNFGPGWEIAEFHHPNGIPQGGWSWSAYGNISGNTTADDRFWVYINDQPANCWN